MIRRIYIKDYVLIEQLDLELGAGLLSITGETGAGKSILIGAIGLVCGARADSKMVREGATKAVVEMECDLDPAHQALINCLREHDLDADEICTLRREITSAGKSRAFVNDTPVTLAVMKRVGEHLLDIHSQHHNMLIGDATYQMAVVDALAETASLLSEYREAYGAMIQARKRYKETQEAIEVQRKEADYIQFQYQQLVEARIQPNEIEETEERLALAQNAQEITEAINLLVALGEGSDDDLSTLMRISAVLRALRRVESAFPAVTDIATRLESVHVELRDLVGDGEHLADRLVIDRDEVERLEGRIDLLQTLLYKHSLHNTQQLIELRDHYATVLQDITGESDTLAALRSEVDRTEQEAKRLAALISEARQAVAPQLLPRLEALLTTLGIAGATFRIDLRPTEHLTPDGSDQITFLLATNKGALLRPIQEIASGGEISRFMLALKSILASKAVLPTVIFDEIDTGVSGEMAAKIGTVMQQLSAKIQVLTITHLPQIAALADHQYVVRKQEQADTFVSTISEVVGEDRVDAVAAMLSGSTITEAARTNARALLK